MKVPDAKAYERNTVGQFSKGASGNPGGRPAGSRNKSTLLLEALLEGEGQKLTRKAIKLALNGDSRALRLCLERLLPARKERLIDLPLPEVQTARDARTALSVILTAVGQGHITPGEGETLAAIVETQKGTIQAEDWESRLEALEKTAKDKKGGVR